MMKWMHVGCMAVASLGWFGVVVASGQAYPYQDTKLSPQQRADDLVGRMTTEEKIAQMVNAAPAIPRLGVPAYDYWNEGLHGIAGRIRDDVSAGDRHGGDMGYGDGQQDGRDGRHRGAREI